MITMKIVMLNVLAFWGLFWMEKLAIANVVLQSVQMEVGLIEKNADV